MRTSPPHPAIKYRHLLFALALLSLIIFWIVLYFFKGNPAVAVSKIAAILALIFIWSNGAYWWVMLRYPYIEIEKGCFYSRNELKESKNGLIFVIYLLLAIFATVACLNIALTG